MAVDPRAIAPVTLAFALRERRRTECQAELGRVQWHRIVPHSAGVRGWTITPSHYLNNQLDTVWLAD